jgi:hypothetical protein
VHAALFDTPVNPHGLNLQTLAIYKPSAEKRISGLKMNSRDGLSCSVYLSLNTIAMTANIFTIMHTSIGCAGLSGIRAILLFFPVFACRAVTHKIRDAVIVDSVVHVMPPSPLFLCKRFLITSTAKKRPLSK